MGSMNLVLVFVWMGVVFVVVVWKLVVFEVLM